MATRFITIRVEILHDKNLTMSQKIILAEIEQLAMLDAGCYASNKHFAEMIGSTKSSVSRTISELEKKGYIGTEIINGSRNHERIITITKLVTPPYQNVKTPLPKCEETKENIHTNIHNKVKTPSVNDIKEYKEEKRLLIDPIFFFNYYETSDWVDNKGKKVKNWKLKMLSWSNREKTKEKDTRPINKTADFLI